MTTTTTRTRTREEYALAITKDALAAAKAVAERLPDDRAGSFTSPTSRREGEITGASRENSLLITSLEEAVFRAQQDLELKEQARDRHQPDALPGENQATLL